jgi:hypothetical protein
MTVEVVETGVVAARLSIDPNVFVNATVVAFGAALGDALSAENLAFRIGVAAMVNERLGLGGGGVLASHVNVTYAAGRPAANYVLSGRFVVNVAFTVDVKGTMAPANRRHSARRTLLQSAGGSGFAALLDDVEWVLGASAVDGGEAVQPLSAYVVAAGAVAGASFPPFAVTRIDELASSQTTPDVDAEGESGALRVYLDASLANAASTGDRMSRSMSAAEQLMVQHGFSVMTSAEVQLSHLTEALQPALQQSAMLQESLRQYAHTAPREGAARHQIDESVVAAQDLLVDMRETLNRAASGRLVWAVAHVIVSCSLASGRPRANSRTVAWVRVQALTTKISLLSSHLTLHWSVSASPISALSSTPSLSTRRRCPKVLPALAALVDPWSLDSVTSVLMTRVYVLPQMRCVWS